MIDPHILDHFTLAKRWFCSRAGKPARVIEVIDHVLRSLRACAHIRKWKTSSISSITLFSIKTNQVKQRLNKIKRSTIPTSIILDHGRSCRYLGSVQQTALHRIRKNDGWITLRVTISSAGTKTVSYPSFPASPDLPALAGASQIATIHKLLCIPTGAQRP